MDNKHKICNIRLVVRNIKSIVREKNIKIVTAHYLCEVVVDMYWKTVYGLYLYIAFTKYVENQTRNEHAFCNLRLLMRNL